MKSHDDYVELLKNHEEWLIFCENLRSALKKNKEQEQKIEDETLSPYEELRKKFSQDDMQEQL